MKSNNKSCYRNQCNTVCLFIVFCKTFLFRVKHTDKSQAMFIRKSYVILIFMGNGLCISSALPCKKKPKHFATKNVLFVLQRCLATTAAFSCTLTLTISWLPLDFHPSIFLHLSNVGSWDDGLYPTFQRQDTPWTGHQSRLVQSRDIQPITLTFTPTTN